MLTTPDELPTPDLGGAYNFVSDIQTLAESVQNTFIKRANSYTGTSAQRVAFTASAPLGALWSDTDGDQLVWKKTSGGWETVGGGDEAVRKFATKALLDAWSAPDGTIAYVTADNAHYVRAAGAWQRIMKRIDSGVVQANNVIRTETFQTPFSEPPHMSLTKVSSAGAALDLIPQITARSATGFSYRLSGSSNTEYALHWIAVEAH